MLDLGRDPKKGFYMLYFFIIVDCFHIPQSGNFSLENTLFLKKFALKIFWSCCFPTKFFNNEIIFRIAVFAYGSERRSMTGDDHRVGFEVRTTNGRVINKEFLWRLPSLFGHLDQGHRNQRANTCRVFESPVMNAIDMPLPQLRMAWQQYSIKGLFIFFYIVVTQLHVLSNSIKILEIISPSKKFVE